MTSRATPTTWPSASRRSAAWRRARCRPSPAARAWIRIRSRIADGRAHLDALAAALARFGKAVRKAIGEAAKAGDADTSDLFTGISRDVDKDLWLVEAHLQSDR